MHSIHRISRLVGRGPFNTNVETRRVHKIFDFDLQRLVILIAFSSYCLMPNQFVTVMPVSVCPAGPFPYA